jgi:hypothetical protein
MNNSKPTTQVLESHDTQSSTAIRYDQDKLRLDLLPVRPLQDIAAVYSNGAKKYSDRNWELGMMWSRCYASLFRHLLAFWSGENLDPESGQPHLAHVAVNAMFLLEYMRTHPELDDRPNKK